MHRLHSLGIFSIALIVVAFYASLFQTSSPTPGARLIAQLGSAVGMSVGVMPNEVNTLAAQLREKEEHLAQREHTVEEREALLRGTLIDQEKTYALSREALSLFGGGLLFALLLANFYLDWRRAKRA